MDKLFGYLLQRYHDAPYMMTLRARFMLSMVFIFTLFMIFALFHVGFLQLNDAAFGYALDFRMLLLFVAGILGAAVGATFIVRGSLTAGSHLVLICGLAVIWSIIVVDRAGTLMRLDTLVFILALLTLTPVVVEREKGAILLYGLVNICVLAIFIFINREALELSTTMLVDYLVDSMLSILAVAIVAYNIFTINRRALLRAEGEIAQRENAEKTLRESEERFRLYFENATELIYVLDRDLRIVNIGPSVERLSGYRPDELIGKPVQDLGLLAPKYIERAYADVQRVLSGETIPSSEYEFILKDGSRRLADISGAPVIRDGRVIGVLSVAKDITDRKKTEEELHRSETKYRSLVENLNDVIFTLDLQGRFTYISPVIERISSYGVEEVIGSEFIQFIHPDDLPALSTSFGRIMEGKIEPFEFRVKDKTGAVRFVRTYSRPVLEGNTITGFTGIMTDITDRKRAEEALQLNEMRLTSLLELSNKTHGLSEKEIITYALEEAVRLTGSTIGYFHFIDDDGETVTLTAWTKNIYEQCTAFHETHFPVSQAGIWAESIRTRRPAVHNDYAGMEGRKALPEGHPVVIRHMSVPVIDRGKIRAISGVGNKPVDYDDTDVLQHQLMVDSLWKIIRRKRAETEQQKLTAIIETSSDFIGIADLEGKALYINEAGQRLLGIESMSKVRGRHMADFVFPEDMEALSPENLLNTFTQKQQIGEFRLKNFGTGKVVPVELNAFLIHDPETREPIAVAVIARDITERKRTERALVELASSDPLTGVFNRRKFFEIASKTFKHSLLQSTSLSVLMIDADHFKEINDRHGHHTGDQALTSLVVLLRAGLRDSDVLGRYGGEEFVVLMPETDLNSAVRVAGRLREGVRGNPLKTERGPLSITISIGVASMDEAHDNAIDDLVRRADEAMYAAKQAGRDCVRAWNDISASSS